MKLSEAARLLSDAGVETPLLDARMLFSRLGGFSDGQLFGSDPDTDDPKVTDGVRRRCEREPMAYVLGEWDFYRETYAVGPAVLVPRSDTELLVDHAVRHLPEGAVFADLCCGSGCVGISVLANTKGTFADAFDISEEALAFTKINAERNGVSDRIRVFKADLLHEFPDRKYHAILANPPYIQTNVYNSLQPEVRKEPKIALVAEEDGMIFYRVFLENLKDSLLPGGFFAFEIGYDQEEKILALAERSGMNGTVFRDFGGQPRLAVLTLR